VEEATKRCIYIPYFIPNGNGFTYIFTKLVFILILLFVEVYALMTCFFLLMFYYSCAMLIVSCEWKERLVENFPFANWTSKDLWARMNYELERFQGFGKELKMADLRHWEHQLCIFKKKKLILGQKRFDFILKVSFSEPCFLS